MKRIWADGGYAGKLVDWTKSFGRWVLDIVKRSDDVAGFAVLPKRWIVERTFGWLGRYRRLSKDYEMLTESSEAMIYLAMVTSGNFSFNGVITPAQTQMILDGLTHINIHSTFRTGGEIRGQIVPEPATAAVLMLGLLGVAGRRRRQRA